MSLVICERCGYEAMATVLPAGGVDIVWPVALAASVCLYARERKAAGEPVGTTCPWLEEEITAAWRASLLDRA